MCFACAEKVSPSRSQGKKGGPLSFFKTSSLPSKVPEQPIQANGTDSAATADLGAQLDTAALEQREDMASGVHGQLQYVVQSGDSLFIIAEKYGVSMTELVQLNKLHFKSTIRPRQVLHIPANSRPQAAVVASVCPAPPPSCPAPPRSSSSGWTVGLGIALLGAAALFYVSKLFQSKTNEKGHQAEGEFERTSVDTVATSTPQPAVVHPTLANPSLFDAKLAATPPLGISAEQVAPLSFPETTDLPETTTASASAVQGEAPSASILHQDLLSPSHPESIAESPIAKAADEISTGHSSVVPPASPIGAGLETNTQPVQHTAEVSAPAVLEEDSRVINGAIMVEAPVSTTLAGAAISMDASLVDILPDGLMPLDTAHGAARPQQVRTGPVSSSS
jgi:LysM repeat protein